MKKYTYSLLAAALACGMAQGAATAYSTPVGYETLAVDAGFNFLGLRLQRPVVVAGKITAIDSSSITDSANNLGTLLDDTKTYILEIKNVNGVTQEFIGSAAVGNVLSTPDLTSVAAVNDLYAIREAPTLSSTFGPNNEAGLEGSFFAFGGDNILLPNPSAPGGFDQFYYDTGLSSWADVDGVAVNGATISWNYADGVVISATGSGLTSLTVSGEVKKANTRFSLNAGSLNFLSSVYPSGATVSSTFGAANEAGLDGSFFAFGGDNILVPNVSAPGGFDQYYYDTGLSSWADVDGVAVDGSTVNLKSGMILVNDGDGAIVVGKAPAFYSSL